MKEQRKMLRSRKKVYLGFCCFRLPRTLLLILVIKIFLSSGGPIPLSSVDANALPQGTGPMTLVNRSLYSFGHSAWFRESSYPAGAIRGLSRTFTLDLLSEKSCILLLPAVQSHRFGANYHGDQFCHCKEGACLGMKLARGRVEERGRGETRIPEYWSILIFSSRGT